MAIVTAGKIYDRCIQCGKLVQLNKGMFGALHFCITNCERAGHHLATREETRGRWRKRTWKVCDECGDEWRQESV